MGEQSSGPGEDEQVRARPELFARPRFIENLDDCFFYHTMELPGLGLRRAHWDLRGKFQEYLGGIDVAGKSVLDVGTATGFLSFEAEKHGARRVVSHDMSDPDQQTFVPFRNKLHYQDPEEWRKIHGRFIARWHNAYWLCHRLLNSRAEVYHGNIYALPPALGQFEVVIVGSVLEHLSDPVAALGSIARLACDTIVIVTPVLESEDRFAQFEPRAGNPDQDYTWWTYSIGMYREVLAILGFRIERVSKGSYRYDFADRLEERTTLIAMRDESIGVSHPA